MTALGDRDAALNGEIVAFDSKDRPSFGLLQHHMHVHKPTAAHESMKATSRTTHAGAAVLHRGHR